MKNLTTPFFSKNNSMDLWRDMDKFFDNFLTSVGTPDRDFVPATEIVEAQNEYKLSMDLPGLSKDEVKIELNDNTLTVSGERKKETHDEKGKVQRWEKSYGFFSRSFALPNTVNSEKIEAKYENGVLTLVLPKAKAVLPKKIDIQ